MGILLKIVGFFGGKKSFSTVVVILLALGGYIAYLFISNSSLEAKILVKDKEILQNEETISELGDKLKDILLLNEANYDKYLSQKKYWKRERSILLASHKKEMARLKKIQTIKEDIQNDKTKSELTPTILINTVNRLWKIDKDH